MSTARILLGVLAVPAICYVLVVALLENIQRQDLNSIEEAQAFQRLIADWGHTQDALAKIVHKSRSHVANLLRLLELPEGVQAMVVDGRLSMGHARALVGAPDAEALAETVVERGVSVRLTEQMVRVAKGELDRPKRAPKPAAAPAAPAAPSEDIAALEGHLRDLLGLPVRISYEDGSGTVSLTYGSVDQLDMILQRLTGEGI